MFDRLTTRPQSRRTVWLSLGAHAVVVAGMLVSLRVHPVRVFSLPGTSVGTRVEIAYLPGRAPAPALATRRKVKTDPSALRTPDPAAMKRAVPAPETLHLPPVPHLTVTESAPSTQGPAAAAPDSTSGSDSFGDGSIQIALTSFSPSPKPDLSALPHGIQGDVVVDVTIDPTGKVAELAVMHTLGYGIESSVIGTLKSWVFHPATKDGMPIASVQELHFHFGPV